MRLGPTNAVGAFKVSPRSRFSQVGPLRILKHSIMSKYNGELTQREQELLKIRRDSDTKAAELVKMEKMLQQTKDMLDKKTEPGAESMAYQENMGL